MSNQSQAYGSAARLLHALALERPFVAETWLDIEELLHGRNLPAAPLPPSHLCRRQSTYRSACWKRRHRAGHR